MTDLQRQMMKGRRQFLATGLAVTTAAWPRPLRAADRIPHTELVWHDVGEWGVEGQGFAETKRRFDRLPAQAEGRVRPAVWNLSRHSAGMLTQFRSDASELYVRYTLLSDRLAMPHMPATGVSGLDLYARDDDGLWRWVQVYQPKARQNEGLLVSGLKPGMRDYRLYLPLYNGTEDLHVGVSEQAAIEPISPRKKPPIVFYGTSITHGACAGRPGMPHPAILGRRLDMPVINLGFSGNGRMEAEVGLFLKEIPAALFVIDCLPNLTGPEVAQRTEPLVKQLRTAQPDVPIVLVEDRSYANAWIRPSAAERNRSSRKALKEAWRRLQSAGVTKLWYVEGETLLSPDGEGTTDGSHPNDLGFVQHADALEPVLRQALTAGA